MAVIDICRTAWNSSKRESQPDYDDLIESYRDMLTARAEAVLATGLVDDGPFASFEQAVKSQPQPITEIDDIVPFKIEEPVETSDQGYEQVVDVPEPFYPEPPAEREEVAEPEAEPVKAEPPKPKKKVAVKPEVKKAAAKKSAPKPKVIKKGKK